MQMQTQRRLMQIPGTAGGIYTDFHRGRKGKKNVLLLNPGKDERKNSTDLLWRVGGYKSNVFDKFDNLRNKNTIKNEPNGIILEVIGKENSKSSFEIASKKIEKIIIPKNIKLSKNQE